MASANLLWPVMLILLVAFLVLTFFNTDLFSNYWSNPLLLLLPVVALAGLLGVPADELQKTIDRYNELVTKGADDDFHKPADFLYPVVKAPFYAAKVGVALLAVVGGLSVNTDLQVLDDEKKPIEGLYATGNTSGDLYAIDYPINMAGNSNGRCVIWAH